MPVHTTNIGQAFYQEFDTAPNLRRQLLDGTGTPINLTGSTVTIDIAHTSYSWFYSPMRRIVEAGPCIVEGGTDGWVQWQPGIGQLSPPGEFRYRFTITYPGGGVQTVPANTSESLIIRERVGGPAGA